jgi:hypothetical protein
LAIVLRCFKRSLVLQVRGDAGRPESMVPDPRLDASAAGDVFIEVLLQTVVTRNLMLLATFFVQPDPSAAFLHEIVTHFRLEHGAYGPSTQNLLN